MIDFGNIERAIHELQCGRMVVIIDDDDRENEGDLVVAGEFVTPDAINFMVTHARGLICVAIDASIAQRMKLYPMVERNQDDLGTNFTVSIDGSPAHGVTTGISAYDRAATVQILLNAESKPSDLRRPGHIFPLVAHPEGVLARRGHTEASTDLCEMAGLLRAAVIVEILSKDGHMAREADLRAFSAKHNFVTVTVEEISQVRKAMDLLNHEVAVTEK
jgi:3,4-dihydroxy 2-butanone 4-phosphate synthase/GTP cyclohydrolase II